MFTKDVSVSNVTFFKSRDFFFNRKRGNFDFRKGDFFEVSELLSADCGFIEKGVNG